MELAYTRLATVTNPDVGDLWLDDYGQTVLLSDLASEVALRLTVRLNFFRGEWFVDLNEGTPWYQHIFTKGPSDAVVRQIFTSILLGTEGVRDVRSLSHSVDARTRRMTLSFVVELDDGQVLTSDTFGAFLVDV